jgi:hypothetical protein
MRLRVSEVHPTAADSEAERTLLLCITPDLIQWAGIKKWFLKNNVTFPLNEENLETYPIWKCGNDQT